MFSLKRNAAIFVLIFGAFSLLFSFSAHADPTATLTVYKGNPDSGTVFEGTELLPGSVINCGTVCSASFLSGASLVLTAKPAVGAVFSHWSGCPSANGATCQLTMNSSMIVTAWFAPDPVVVLTVNKGGTGSGTVFEGTELLPGSVINCGTVCSASFLSGASLVLTATPAAGSVFTHWQGCPSANGAKCNVQMNSSMTITANFSPDPVAVLTVNKSGAGTGTVFEGDVLLPGSVINCGSTCTASFLPGASFVLTARPNSGSVFTSWSGCPSANGATCTVQMNSLMTITANFSANTNVAAVLTVKKTGSGTVFEGDVLLPGSVINCGSTCTASFLPGASFVLTAKPASGSVFKSWQGCPAATGATCRVQMNSSMTVTANFAAGGISIGNNEIPSEDLEVREIKSQELYDDLKGTILIKTEDVGKAYYVNPLDSKSYYLGRPQDAYTVMREQGVGITNADLQQIPIGLSEISGPDQDGDGLSDIFEDAISTDKTKVDTDGDGFADKVEVMNGYNPNGSGMMKVDTRFAQQQEGKIVLQVENHGEAWYVNTKDNKRYFLGRAEDAFNIMKKAGLGISNKDFDILN